MMVYDHEIAAELAEGELVVVAGVLYRVAEAGSPALLEPVEVDRSIRRAVEDPQTPVSPRWLPEA